MNINTNLHIPLTQKRHRPITSSAFFFFSTLNYTPLKSHIQHYLVTGSHKYFSLFPSVFCTHWVYCTKTDCKLWLFCHIDFYTQWVYNKDKLKRARQNKKGVLQNENINHSNLQERQLQPQQILLSEFQPLRWQPHL